MAQNVPGPVAVSRLVADGWRAIKIEPPAGDPLARLCAHWYEELHRGVIVERINLKSVDGAAQVRSLLNETDVFLASHRPSALTRLGLDAASLHRDFPSLSHVNIVGDTANPEAPGHDLTYQARAGLLSAAMPLTLTADMAGAERAHAVIKDAIHQRGTARLVGLYDVLRDLAAPLYQGLTVSGGALGGGNPAYAIYRAREGAIAVAALEPHFRARLYDALSLADGDDPTAVFATKTAADWERWAAERDIPLAGVSPPFSTSDRDD
jgi:crotonobetainyl-CoA:carnitine CoA-transferase CaiB-like acyl-CoA transferase